MTTTNFHPTPGDVAMVTALNRSEPYRAYYDGRDETWREAAAGASFCVDEPTSIRPLVVVDPETICPAFRGVFVGSLLAGAAEVVAESVAPRQVHEVDLLNALADMFDEATGVKPHKPAEPTGLGAVVEDADGYLWVRPSLTSTVNHWRCAEASGIGRKPYSKIAAVRVVSEGVLV